jgi:hypothetical protein
MKSLRILAVLALAAGLAVSLSAEPKNVTVEGTLVDSMCYLKDNSLVGNDHGPMKNCGTMCLRGGIPGGVLTKDKKFHAIIAPAAALADHVGQTIRVTGTDNNGSLLAQKIEVQKDGRWEEIKLGAMM